MKAAPTETRADLQRYFGIDVRTADPFLSAACARCLPLGSAAMARIDERYTYTMHDYLLHALLSIAARKEIPYPWERPDNGIGALQTMGVDEFDAWANQEWKDAGNGN